MKTASESAEKVGKEQTAMFPREALTFMSCNSYYEFTANC
jgi:hypothetical protein